MTDKTGGSAFPLAYIAKSQVKTHGMTLRDYFAAKAMQGDWASQSAEVGYFTPKSTDGNLDNAAEVYYRMADAMLRVRGK
ncbi:hypothetical protein ACYTIM_000698 [Morganella morganii]